MIYKLEKKDIAVHSEFSEYLSVWQGSIIKRPHDHPQYMKLMCPEKYRAAAIILIKNNIPILIYPYYWVNISDCLDVSSSLCRYKHMMSAYGYGGPVFTTDRYSRKDIDCFYNLFSDFLFKENFISEFIREDLLLNNKASGYGTSILQQDNVIINLKKKKDELWSSYKHSTRKNINRAIASGLKVSFDFTGNNLDGFYSIYQQTMARKNAKSYFFISKHKFHEFNECIKNDNLGFYVHVYHEDKIVASELLLCSKKYIYSFLGGADMESSPLRPSDFLKHQVNLWAIENNYDGYVLGGGVKPNDGIFKFKLSFDPEGVFPFYVQKNIYQHDIYNQIIKERKIKAKLSGIEWCPDDNFFPTFFS